MISLKACQQVCSPAHVVIPVAYGFGFSVSMQGVLIFSISASSHLGAARVLDLLGGVLNLTFPVV